MGNLILDDSDFVACPAPAKINLFLHVTGRRADGYHTLQTAFCMLDRSDILYFRVRTDGVIHRVNDVPGVPEEQDLVVRAARLLQTHTACSLGIDVRVDKHLPMGGGLGGGSSDAATTLLALNKLWKLRLKRPALQALALTLGADVPFFVYGRTAIAEGVGEELKPLSVPPAWYVVIQPPVSVPTPEIFRDQGLTRDTEAVIISASPVGGGLQEKLQISLQSIAKQTRNDLQPVACRLYPEVQQALDALLPFYTEGSVEYWAPRMSGSGACVFLPCATQLLAEKVVEELSTDLSKRWRVWCATSLDVHPLHDWVENAG